MPNYICTTCGIQYAESETVPESCLICEDERQYVHPDGQTWTTLAELQATRKSGIRAIESGLYGVATDPHFAIGQRPLLIQSDQGNVLWDCTSLIDDGVIEAISALGGIASIAISHPHFYGSMVEWSRAFGDAPIYLPAADRQWVTRPDANITFWEGDSLTLNDEMTLIRCGGHFEGSTVLHWRTGVEGKGALLTGDTISVVADRRFVTFMYSFPNTIPLNARAVQGIVDAVEPLHFERLYGGWWSEVVVADAKESVRRSAQRYIRAIAA